MSSPIFVGTSGWGLPAASRDRFPPAGSTLARYAARLHAAEINSTFYRSHRPATLARWIEQTPPGFRFAVKTPRELTHVRKLADCAAPIDQFLQEIAPLAPKLGPVLIQLPPSLAFEAEAAAGFLEAWRERFAGMTALEPRHVSWFGDLAGELLVRHRIARVAADPACCEAAARPGGWPGLAYWRWHGSPRMYSSAYSQETLGTLAKAAAAAADHSEAWVVFDNTMHGAAIAHALDLSERLH